jgi:23S rRNA pseudouridine1911/1915/1917 synthase
MVIPPLPTADLAPEQIQLSLVHEDEDIIVVDKPAGMVTHPAAGNLGGTLVNALLHHFPRLSTLPGKDRPGIVHRLDKDTSGLIVVAKTNLAYLRLQQMIQRRQLSRTYVALVCGHVKSQGGVIELPIGRSPRDRKKMAVTTQQGREAVTRYRVQDRFRSYDLLQVDLETGRTHQIRVHFSHLGHPVFGDPDYGGRHKWHRGQFAPERPLGRKLLRIMSRQALHAARLQFTHPRSGEHVDLSSELPPDFRQVLDLLDSEGR